MYCILETQLVSLNKYLIISSEYSFAAIKMTHPLNKPNSIKDNKVMNIVVRPFGKNSKYIPGVVYYNTMFVHCALYKSESTVAWHQ